MKLRYVIPLVIGTAALSLVAGARAAQTNYLGTVFVADTTTPTHQLSVNSDGSLNVVCH